VDTLTTFADTLQKSGISQWMQGSLKALPIIESVHVMAIVTVFGTILLIDLRLLGLYDTNRPFTRVFRDVLHWTWIAFAVAVVTGILLFIPNAPRYVVNTAFGLKMALLVCAGFNMAIFEFTTLKKVAIWDNQIPTPTAARIAGITSLVLWTSVLVCGRVIGFTKGYDFSVPDDVDFDFLNSCVECVARHLTGS
jgi:hypothetical protein